jgi:hypothetical protein
MDPFRDRGRNPDSPASAFETRVLLDRDDAGFLFDQPADGAFAEAPLPGEFLHAEMGFAAAPARRSWPVHRSGRVRPPEANPRTLVLSWQGAVISEIVLGSAPAVRNNCLTEEAMSPIPPIIPTWRWRD